MSPLATRARLTLAVVVVGVLAGAFAVAFRWLLHHTYAALLGDENILRGVAALPVWACIALPATGGAVAAVVIRYGRAGNTGVGGVMEAVTLRRGRIAFRASLVRVAACFAAVATGGSIGREGPLIQFGAGIGDAAGRLGRLTAQQRQLAIAAGTSAGFAAAYGTPLAAILFVCEVVTISTAVRMVLPVAVAGVAAAILAGFGPLYGARSYGLGADIELAAFALLGVLAGLLGAGFMALLRASEHGFARLPIPAPARAAIGGALVGTIAIWVPHVAGNGYEAIRAMLDVGAAAGAVALLLVAKAVATSASVGAGTPGGVFTPSLLLGAALGRLFALALAACGWHAIPGAYAVAGMAALCAATTHAPLMACVMVLELTDDSTLIVPVLLCTALATATARLVHRESLYTDELRRRGIAWPDAGDPQDPEDFPDADGKAPARAPDRARRASESTDLVGA